MIVVVSSFIIANPAARQLVCRRDVMGVPAHGWQMMSGFGDAVCDVRFRYKTPAGTPSHCAVWATVVAAVLTFLAGVDIFADTVLRHHEMFRSTNPPRQRKVQRKDLKDVTSNLCQKLPHGSEVYADVRCGSNGEWHMASNKDVDACRHREKPFYVPLPKSSRTQLVCNFVNMHFEDSTWIGFVSGLLLTFLFLAIISTFAPSQHVHRIPLTGLVLGLTSSQVGSTRGLGLVRIATASIFWARYGLEMLPFQFTGVFNSKSGPDIWAALMGMGLLASTAAMLVGFKSQLSSAATAVMAGVLLYWYGHKEGHEEFTHHHCVFHAMLPLLLACTPCGKSFSIDRMMKLRSGVPEIETGPLWGIFLFKLHVSVVYLFSAYDKMTPAWYDGHRLEQMTMYLYTGSYFPAIPGMEIDRGRELVHTLSCIFGTLTIAAELAIGLGIWYKATRNTVFALGVALHGSMYVFCPVSTFSVSVYTAYLAILDPQIVDLFTGCPPPPSRTLDADSNAKNNSKGKQGKTSMFSPNSLLTALIIVALAVAAVPHHREGLMQILGQHTPPSDESQQLRPDILVQPDVAASPAPLIGRDVAALGRFEANFQGRDRTGQSLDVSTPKRVQGLIRVRGFNKNTHTAAKGSPILTRDGKILVGSDTGALFCFQLDRENVTLDMLWSSGTWPSANGIHGTPCIIDDVAFVGAYDGALYAFDIGSGRLLWKTQVSVWDRPNTVRIRNQGTA